MRLPALVPFIVLFAAACGSSSTSPSSSSGGGSSGGGTSTGSSSLTATVDGVAFKPVTVTARLGANNGYLEVDATDSALTLLSLAAGPVNGTVGVGTYDVNSLASAGTNGNYVLVGGTGIWTAALGHGSGSVTITSLSIAGKTASGTFSFVMSNSTGTSTKTVTNGTFNVTLP